MYQSPLDVYLPFLYKVTFSALTIVATMYLVLFILGLLFLVLFLFKKYLRKKYSREVEESALSSVHDPLTETTVLPAESSDGYTSKLQPEEPFPYKKRLSVMTEREKSFFRQLEEEYGNDYYIFPQIKLDKLMEVDDFYRYQYKDYEHLNKINRKSVDFILADKTTLETRLAIELDDSTHWRLDRKQRDEFVEDILERCEIPLQRFSNF